MGSTVDWEYMDGSCGHSGFGGDYEGAEKFARGYALKNPSARVWLNGEIIQQGFRASDDESRMF